MVVAGLAAVAALLCAALMPGCADRTGELEAWRAARIYPPEPQTPRVIALGVLRGGPPPSEAQIKLSEFLFGAEPPPQLVIGNPTALAVDGPIVLICDAALDTILGWDAQAQQLKRTCDHPAFAHPFAVAIAPAGQRVICDLNGVWLCDGRGNTSRAYRYEGGPYKPTGVLVVDDTVWVSNSALHRIEVFDLLSGQYLRAIGEQGTGPGQFALPRDMALRPDGNICVVDMLNARVQVLTPAGEPLFQVGQAGDTVGSFGRPKDVAVGPDGTIFVTDAFSQRVHAFTSDGRPLLAFGEPFSGIGELRVPNGVAVSLTPPTAARPDPEHEAEYYVLVAEQLLDPGVRIYAWLGVEEEEVQVALPVGQALSWTPSFPEATVVNPHWDPQRCELCHEPSQGAYQPIALDETDALCLSCHDGVRAPADPHPIGRPANTELVTTPGAWPTIGGNIACITCHDVVRHCKEGARRPAVNSVVLRDFNPVRPLDYCTICHRPDTGGRFSPHQQRDAQGRVREDACFFCHTERPNMTEEGRRQFDPKLRVESSALCLNCHSPHWDLSPEGHVDRPVTPRIRQWMLMRELSLEHDAPPAKLAQMAAQLNRDPARVPLGDGMVTCYSCHNPHYNGLFPPDSELGALAENPVDRASALRTDWIELCSECHYH